MDEEKLPSVLVCWELNLRPHGAQLASSLFLYKNKFLKTVGTNKCTYKQQHEEATKYIKLYSKTFLEVQKSLVNSWDNSVRNLFTIQFPVLAIPAKPQNLVKFHPWKSLMYQKLLIKCIYNIFVTIFRDRSRRPSATQLVFSKKQWCLGQLSSISATLYLLRVNSYQHIYWLLCLLRSRQMG